jgi:hypothetical protein
MGLNDVRRPLTDTQRKRNAPSGGGNVNLVENPVRRVLGYPNRGIPERTTYNGKPIPTGDQIAKGEYDLAKRLKNMEAQDAFDKLKNGDHGPMQTSKDIKEGAGKSEKEIEHLLDGEFPDRKYDSLRDKLRRCPFS